VLLSSTASTQRLSLARKLVERLPNGYMNPGRTRRLVRRSPARPDRAVFAVTEALAPPA